MERHFTDACIRSLKPRTTRYEEFRDGALAFVSPPKGLRHGYTVIKSMDKDISLL